MKKSVLLLLIGVTLCCVACSNDDTYYVSTPSDYKASQIAAVGSLFDNIARQPEMTDQLIAATAALAGYNDISELAPLDDKAVAERGLARGEALGLCFTAIARQPEAAETLQAAAEQFLGAYGSSCLPKRLNDYSRTAALNGLNEALARQPEAFDALNACTQKILGVTLEKTIPQ